MHGCSNKFRLLCHTLTLTIGRWLPRVMLVSKGLSRPLRNSQPCRTCSWISPSPILGLLTVTCGKPCVAFACPSNWIAVTWGHAWCIAARSGIQRSLVRLTVWKISGGNWPRPMAPCVRNARPSVSQPGLVSCIVCRLLSWVSSISLTCGAVDSQRPGVNPHIFLALDSGFLDPRLFAIVMTLRDHRSVGSAPAQLAQLREVTMLELSVPSSVSTILVQRCHQVGWAVLSDGQVRDCYGLFSLHDVSWQELEVRLRWAWDRVLAQQVHHRSDLGRFLSVDLAAARTLLASLNPSDQGVYRKLLTGGQLTNGEAWRWSENGSDVCRFCGSPDSRFHRFWECPHTLDLRTRLPP